MKLDLYFIGFNRKKKQNKKTEKKSEEKTEEKTEKKKKTRTRTVRPPYPDRPAPQPVTGTGIKRAG